MTEPTEGASAPDRFNVARLHARISSMGSGDQASLRRDPMTSLAFYKLHAEQFPKVSRPETMMRWGALVRAVAILGELYSPTISLGAALAAGGFSELRLTRLLRAQGEQLEGQVVACARFLAAKGQSHDMRGLYALLTPGSGHARSAEYARQRIASDYFQALS